MEAIQGWTKITFPGSVNVRWNNCVLCTCCRQENATVSPHIHKTWEGYFSPALYTNQRSHGRIVGWRRLPSQGRGRKPRLWCSPWSCPTALAAGRGPSTKGESPPKSWSLRKRNSFNLSPLRLCIRLRHTELFSGVVILERMLFK